MDKLAQIKILVTGGAGYIGSHMVKMLSQAGYTITTLDDLSTGYRDSVVAGEFVFGNCGDKNLLHQLLSQNFDAVMHFASFIQVGESVLNPSKYYQNNLVNTFNLLDAMQHYGVKHFIFSSTAATFGKPKYIPIDEYHLQAPINPYGRSKLMVEQLLSDYDRSYGLRSVCLRYFNAAGADPEGQIGERHDPETHLIPLLLRVASGRNSHITVYGYDYDTPDGTCIRDYIHIHDLCSAHLLALQSLINGSESQAYNLGNGNGYSVQEVINMVEKLSGKKIKVIKGPRREGDPDRLIADSRLIRQKLGWTPRYDDLSTIIKHAWEWELKLNT